MSYPESSDREGHLYSTACTLLESNHQTAHNSAQKKLLARAAQRSFLRPVPEYHPSVFEASQGGSIRFDEESKVHGRVVRNETSMSPICSRIFRIGDRTFVDAQIPVAVAGCDEWNNLYFARVFCQIKSVILWRIRIRFTQLLGTWCSWHFWSATYAVEQFNSAHADIRSTSSVVIRSGLLSSKRRPQMANSTIDRHPEMVDVPIRHVCWTHLPVYLSLWCTYQEGHIRRSWACSLA